MHRIRTGTRVRGWAALAPLVALLGLQVGRMVDQRRRSPGGRQPPPRAGRDAVITFSVVRWYDGGAEGRRTLHDKFKTPRDAEAAAQLWRDHPRDWVAVDALRHGVDVPHRAHNAEAISRYEAMRRFAIKADKGDERAAMALDGLLKLDDWREASERAKGGDARS